MKGTELKVIDELSHDFGIDLPPSKSLSELKNILAAKINHLINHDFEKLVRILYRMDVSEKRLKQNLQEQKQNAGAMIAEMMIERQLQKIRSREQFKSNNDIPENEKW
jgi:hypothetical protein